MSSGYQEFYKCEYCGYEYAEYWSNNYSNSWHCHICDANEYGAGDSLYDEVSNEKDMRAWLVSEHGRRYTPTDNKLVKAKILAQLVNDVFKYSNDADNAYSYMDGDIIDYLKFKYKLVKTLDINDSFLESCKEVIKILLCEED